MPRQLQKKCQLAEVQKEANGLANRLTGLDYDLDNLLVKSPVDGTVVAMNVFTHGGVIAPGFRMMDIVPSNDPLIVDGQLPVHLIDKVHPDLEVELIFSAFNQNQTPHVPGIVTQVSADRLVDEKSGQPYYNVKAKVAPEGMKLVSSLNVRPGMPVELFVKTGERTMMNYLVKPVLDHLKMSINVDDRRMSMNTLSLTRLLASLVCAAALGQGHPAFAVDMQAAAAASRPLSAPGQAPDAPALGVLQAYEAALANDPTYRAARHENAAGQEYKVLGRSHLLPVLSANYSTQKNRADITTASVTGDRTEQRNYTSLAAAVQLRQPLYYPEGIARYRQGMAQTLVSDAQFSARSQDLIVRLVTLYAGAQYAQDQLAQATAQRQAYAEQRQSVQRMLQNGEGTRTEVLEAQAKLDLAQAQVIEASDNVVNANDALAAMVGRNVSALAPLSDDFQARAVQPGSFEEWKEVALANNPEIMAQRLAVEIAREEINKIQAGHTPRLDLVASAGKNNSDTINTFSQNTNIVSIGVQLTIPLYAGGSVSAATRQAVSNHEKAQADLESRTSQVLVELRKQYHLTQSSVSRIDATATALRSAQLLVDATQKSVMGGQRTNLDVLNAQQQLYEVRRDLSLSRFNYLLGFLRLRYSAGTLGLADLKNIAAYFVASR